MDLNALASLVERGDPDRFLAAMAAPLPARGPLLVLAAFNLELARAPWVTKEPLIAQMRLQFWRDVVTGEGPAAHEVALPLRALMRDAGLPQDLVLDMIAAREAEVGQAAPFTAPTALWDYCQRSAGALMALSVMALGGPRSDAARELGTVQGLANYLAAVPALRAAGRQPLPAGTDPGVLAHEGRRRLAAIRPALAALPRVVRPALRAAWRADALLRRAEAAPEAVLSGGLSHSEFQRRGSLLWRVATGLI